MRTLAGVAAVTAMLARGLVKPVGDDFLRDGDDDVLLAWTDGHRVRASIRPDGGRFSAPRTLPGLQEAIANDSLTGLAIALAGPDGRFGAPQQLAGTPGSPRRLTPTGGLGDERWARPGQVAIPRAVRGTPFGPSVPAPLPAGAHLGAFSVLRDGALALAFSRPCGRGARVADVVIRPVRGAWSKPVRVNRCGDPEPVLVDATGRALFVAAGARMVAWSGAPIQRYTRRPRGSGSQRSGR